MSRILRKKSDGFSDSVSMGHSYRVLRFERKPAIQANTDGLVLKRPSSLMQQGSH